MTVDLGNVGALIFYEDLRLFRPSWAKGRAKTCASALGFSFAAGTTDGPGAFLLRTTQLQRANNAHRAGDFDFKQADKTGNALWDAIRDFIVRPSRQQEHCQHPKPVLLSTGEINVPYACVAGRRDGGGLTRPSTQVGAERHAHLHGADWQVLLCAFSAQRVHDNGRPQVRRRSLRAG